MAKTKTINQNTLVNEIMTVGGVNKVNATGIFNLFTNAWNTDRINFLKAVDSGIVVKRTPTKRTPAKKTTTTPIKRTPAKKAKGSIVGKVKVKTKGKKKLKLKKAKISVPETTKGETVNASA